MNYDWLPDYLATRRLNWPYDDIYHIENAGAHRFVAWVGDELAGLSWVETAANETDAAAVARDANAATGIRAGTEADTGTEARMRMTLKPQFAEFGIGTELLALLMADLQNAGFDVIRYEIDPRYYSVQIYRNLGFVVETGDRSFGEPAGGNYTGRIDDNTDRVGDNTGRGRNTTSQNDYDSTDRIRFVWRRDD